jgi:hypothetical protein
MSRTLALRFFHADPPGAMPQAPVECRADGAKHERAQRARLQHVGVEFAVACAGADFHFRTN